MTIEIYVDVEKNGVIDKLLEAATIGRDEAERYFTSVGKNKQVTDQENFVAGSMWEILSDPNTKVQGEAASYTIRADNTTKALRDKLIFLLTPKFFGKASCGGHGVPVRRVKLYTSGAYIGCAM